MPQVDHLTFLSQAFWVIVLFLGFFFFISKWGIGVVKNNISIRFLNILKIKEVSRSAFVYSIYYNVQNSCKSIVVYNYLKNALTRGFVFFECWSKYWALSTKNDINTFKSISILQTIKNQVLNIIILKI